MDENPRYRVIWRKGFGQDIARVEASSRRKFQQRIVDDRAQRHVKGSHLCDRPVRCPDDEQVDLVDFIENEMQKAAFG
jgi:hypothetical protein